MPQSAEGLKHRTETKGADQRCLQPPPSAAPLLRRGTHRNLHQLARDCDGLSTASDPAARETLS
jgi:hypothetical protein